MISSRWRANRWITGATAAIIAAGALQVAPTAATAAEPDAVLTPNPAVTGPAFEGWGTSLVWMANATGGYPDELRNALIDKVFGDEGLNLNIARYNIGGGNASGVADYLRPGGAVPGWWNAEAPLSDDAGAISSNYDDRDRYLASWTGETASDYDFTADAAQLAWVDAIKDQVTTWEAFSNSPPYFMTESGYTSGGFDSNAEQIKPEAIDKFATYLKTVVERVEDNHGISFDTIDPLNEPNTNYWGTELDGAGKPTGGRQEGAHVGPQRQAEVLTALAAELAEDGTTTKAALSGPDETNPGRFITDWEGWTAEAKQAVAQLNVHTYGTGDRLRARDVAKSADKPLWMSEVEGNWGGGWNPASISNGLGVAERITDDLRELDPSAWVLWQPLEDLYNMQKTENQNWGSIFVDFDCNADGDSERRIADGDADPSCKVLTNTKFDTIRNFTHYIEPGDRIVPTNDSRTTSAVKADGTGAVLVHANHGDSGRTVRVDLSRFADIAADATVTPVVTTESPAADPSSDALVAGTSVKVDPVTKSAVLTVPARSVTTFVVTGVSGAAADAPAIRDGETFRLIGSQSTKPLAGTSAGAALGDAAASDADATQLWTATRVTEGDGTARDRFVLRLADGRALAVDGDKTTLRAVSPEEAADDESVQWMMNSTNGSTFSLLSAARDRVLDVSDQSTSVGAKVGVWTSNAGANQQFRIVASDARVGPTYTSFNPGDAWLDDNGKVIQAHGGQVLPSTDDEGKTIYYLYGEDRTNGYHSAPGVHVYSSYDLYNWTDEGLALRSLASKAQFDEPYFDALYGDYTQQQKDAVYRDLGTVPVSGVTPPIIERPKVIHNEATGKWVMWAHMDGPSESSSAQYAKAKAGVAISDSPVGPFRYIDSYNLHHSDEGWGVPGMARDMNLFVDDDGTGYIIYSSEDNATMYISKLDAEYTDLATPADEAVEGVDYNRIFVGWSRESPAIFKHDERYFLITSGTTGWSPNPSKYASATDILGDWTEHGDPFPWWAQSNSWNTQPSSVIPVDREAGKYIYMGDRWNGGSDDALRNAPLVWLPINLGEGGDRLSIEIYDEWTVGDLDKWSAWDVSGVPASVKVGEKFDVPNVTVRQNGTSMSQPVSWTFSGSFDVPGAVVATGTMPEFGGRTFSRTISVVPENVRYAVNAGGQKTADWLALVDVASDQASLLNSIPDQKYGADADTQATWGYLGDKNAVATEGNTMFHTLRYAKEGADLAYRFDGLEPGDYTVYAGYYDPWAQWDDRGAKVTVNGSVVEADHDYDAKNQTATYADVAVGEDGRIDFALSPTRGTDVQLSWLIVTADDVTPPAPAIDVTFTATVKCVRDKATVAAQLRNDGDVPVSVTFESDLGSKKLESIDPGANGTHAFSTRKASVVDGMITAQLQAVIGGETVTESVDAAYTGDTCN
ncbi:family 43 glycosylhydrolase [Microbacterium sp. H1-D42]|uniref:family 43 glycosylhydrolase n=1 Tax=Microbacterium sp. H1-D42 TaxID=2925844 RepID=UPI001F52D070|nr:family 43 glycosylhydrolase [Microbacterium sp. H1-D42]UNK70329.1 family 43 glycosylhydrolase [Microbacterium sp. H1-D42]